MTQDWISTKVFEGIEKRERKPNKYLSHENKPTTTIMAID